MSEITIKDLSEMRASAEQHVNDSGLCVFWLFALVDGHRKKTRVLVSLEALKDETFLIEEMMLARMRRMPGGDKAQFLGFEMLRLGDLRTKKEMDTIMKRYLRNRA